MEKANEINGRIIRLKLIDGSYVTGTVNINRKPGYDRLSDLLLDGKEEFLIVTGATISKSDMENYVRQDTVFLNKRHILWAAPENDQR